MLSEVCLDVFSLYWHFFCVLRGVISYDDAKTNQKYKISGICINIVAIFIGITFIMM